MAPTTVRCVIKLGGSLYNSAQLIKWLDMIVEFGGGKVILVPGGGPFADTVRCVQPKAKISDACAHQMALLAMAQYGLMLHDLQNRLRPANSCASITNLLNQSHVPLWLPDTTTSYAEGIEKNWSMTSDSLAIWLAIECQARRVILIKHQQPESDDIQKLSQTNQVDAACPEFAKKFANPVSVLGQNQLEEVQSFLMAI